MPSIHAVIEPSRTPSRRAERDFITLRRAPPLLEATPQPRITVSWTRVDQEQTRGALPAQLELTVSYASPNARWVCLTPFAQNWLEIIAAKPCSEIVLTARLADDSNAKHLVLELAERLTQQLSAAQPLIRVRFLPTSRAARAVRRRA